MIISPLVEEALKDGHVQADESSWDDKCKVHKGVKGWLVFVEKKYMSPWNGLPPSREATSLTTI